MSAKSMYRDTLLARIKRQKKRDLKVAAAIERSYGLPLKQYGWQLLRQQRDAALHAMVGR